MEEEKEEERWGVFTVTVRVQRSATITSAVIMNTQTTARGANQPPNVLLLRPEWACFLTPPAAPSSGGPLQTGKQRHALIVWLKTWHVEMKRPLGCAPQQRQLS